jgi:hypothetical protein
MSWNSPWFEIEGRGTYSEGLEREPTIITIYSIDSSQQTLDVSIQNATPLLVYWLEREDVSNQSENTQAGEEESEDGGNKAENTSDPCAESCLDLARNSLRVLMIAFFAIMLYNTRSDRLRARLSLGASWISCFILIIFLIPLAAAADFGIFSGSNDGQENSATGGFDSNTQDSVQVDQFAHFSSDSGSKFSSRGIIFTYQSSGFDLGLLEEEDRGEVIDNPPEDGEPGYESLIRFDGELVAGPGPMVTWWLLTLPICAYVQIPTRTDDEEE